MGGLHYNDHNLAPWPAGLIIMWYGNLSQIPPGWILCNGHNNTPDLRDRFVLCAGGPYAPGARGGAFAVNHRHGVSIQSSSPLSNNQHRISEIIQTFKVGGRNHKHQLNTNTSYTNLDITPPYFALAYLMKLSTQVSPTAKKHWNEGNIVQGRGFPIGTVLPWSGSIETIPEKWALCDGGSGRPDLRNRFVIGAGTKDIGAKGGAFKHTHGHSISANSAKSADTRAHNPGIAIENFGGPDHVHSVNGDTGNVEVDHTPPYYALAFMIKEVA